MRTGTGIAIAVVVAICVAPTPARAALDPETKCEARQLKAAGKLCKAAFKCLAKVTRTLDFPAFDACIDKATNKHTNAYNAALAKAVKVGSTCEISDAAENIQTRIGDEVGLIHEAVLEGWDFGNVDDRKLRAKLEKLAAKQCSAAFAAERRHTIKPDGAKRAAARDRAMAKLEKSARKAIAKAEKKSVVYGGTPVPSLADAVDQVAGAHVLENALASSPATAADRIHVLDRIGYGFDDWSLQRITDLGLAGYIAEQLEPNLPENPELATMLAPFASLDQTMNELRLNYPLGGPLGGVPISELTQAKMIRAVASRRQLEAVLTDFWFNHFNEFAFAQNRLWDTTSYERDAIRPNVFARFPDLVRATARHPAMLTYLDNWLNGEGGSINENYARELLELHTLGVDADYTQQDVIEVARVLSGWTLSAPGPFGLSTSEDGFAFEPALHDANSKSIMGELEIPAGGGVEEGEAVIEFIGTHPNAARFIAEKLAKRFVADEPPEALVDSVARAFLRSGGDLRVTLERLLISEAFLLDPQYRRAKVKRPHHVLASAVRSTRGDPVVSAALNSILSEATGERLYGEPPPTGYPETTGVWAAEGALITRLNALEGLILAIVDGFDFTFDATKAPADFVAELEPQLFPAGLTDDTRDAILAYGDELVAQGVEDGPRAIQLFTLMLSSPDFLLH